MVQAEQWDALVDGLRQYGIHFLSGGDPDVKQYHQDGQPPTMSPVVLMEALARSDEPRLRRVLTALFLLRPELAADVEAVATNLPPRERERFIHAFVAAVYLQRLWRTRLRRYLGGQPDLPPLWIDDLQLPAPDDRFGRMGLYALAEREQRRNRRADPYLRVSQQLFGQLLAERAAA